MNGEGFRTLYDITNIEEIPNSHAGFQNNSSGPDSVEDSTDKVAQNHSFVNPQSGKVSNRFITPEQDAEYMNAAESMDKDTADMMGRYVDETALPPDTVLMQMMQEWMESERGSVNTEESDTADVDSALVAVNARAKETAMLTAASQADVATKVSMIAAVLSEEGAESIDAEMAAANQK